LEHGGIERVSKSPGTTRGRATSGLARPSLVDGETYLEYHDELVNEYDVIDFLMSLGATEYDY
jgi:hypothetical protein